jgi:PAS domain S-box-containing protein
MRDGNQSTRSTTITSDLAAADPSGRMATVALGVAVFALAIVSLLFTVGPGRVATIWPINAAILTAILLAPPTAWRRYLLVGLAGSLVANLAVGDSALTSLVLVFCNGVEIGLCLLMLRRLVGPTIDLNQQRHLVLFLLASVCAPLISGLCASLALGAIRHAPFVATFREWFAADALGLLVVTPALLALTPESLRTLAGDVRTRRNWPAAVALVVMLAMVFGQSRYTLYFLIPPTLVFVAFRLGLAGSAIGLLVTAAVGVLMTLNGQGDTTFNTLGVTDRLEMLQGVMAVMTIMVLPVAAALAKRRRLENELREANRLSALANQIGGVGHWRNDLVTGERHWSEQAYAIHGMPRDPEAPRRPLGIGLYHPDDQAKIRDTLRQVAASGEAFEIKLRFSRADDAEERIVVLKGEGERDSRGKVRAVFGVMRDITEEETSRERVEASEQRFRLLADSSTDIVVKVNMADIIEYISPAIRRYGYDPRALIGVRRGSLVHPDDEVRLRGIRETLFATDLLDPALDRSYRMRAADGRYVWMEGNPTLIRDPSGAPIALISQLRDVNERRLAVDALAESEARYRIIAENVTDIVSRTTVDGQIVYLSPSLKDVLGYDPDTLLGQSIVPYLHPDDLQANLPIYQQIVAGERTGKTGMIYRLLHQDGHWVWVESNPILIRDRDGAPSELIDVARDVSARVQVELELRAARDSAEEAAQVKSAFLANMSHEIRTPLTAILGFTDLLAEQPDLSAMARGRVERVAGAGQALLSIVNDVLDFSKLEAGHFEITARPVSPERVLREALLMFSPQAEAKGLSLEFAADALPAGLSMDPDRVRQILLNLIGNAIKFTDQGSIRLTAAYDTAHARLAVSITDTGAGMSSAQQTKLFQRFSQVDASLTRRHGGTGLGLAICKGITEAMGGEIRVTSEPGVGSTFHFHIAAPLAEMPRATDEGEQVAAPLAGLRVLVVDDNAVNRELARAVLEPFGAEVFDAEDGVAGVAAALSQPVDVILMDIRMPGLDGPAALKEIRAAEGPNRETPILAFTADADLGRLENELGFDGIVRKPIVATALAEAIYEAAHAPVTDHAGDLDAAELG